jgi:hypothetical protein
MNRRLFSPPVVAGLWLSLATPSGAIQIRSYSAERHDRFTGFPDAPVWNDAAWFDSRGISGVGWAPADPGNKRQFALVSPQHIVCATHYQPGLGTTIRFLSSDGVTVDRSVASLTPVKNDLDQNTDLTLATLSSPLLASDKVAHLAYLNLANESAYLGISLTVIGWQAKAGTGMIARFEDLAEAWVNKTRMVEFEYLKLSGNQDDSYLESGDSGSPTLAMAGGNPALVGIHTAVDDNSDPIRRTSYDTFVPHYIAALNALMAADGYQMTPGHPLEASATTTPTQWRKATPGTSRFDIKNASANEILHLTITLSFPPAAVPDTLTAPGWTITSGAPNERLLERASLQAGTTASITAGWLDLGTSDSLDIELALAADGSAQRSFHFNHALAPSYNAWAVGLPVPAPAADPDGDDIQNMLEYAFGGDPAVASATMASGATLAPVLTASAESVSLGFPVRDDALLRGLSYVTEFSGTLAPGSWSTTPPPGYALVDAAFDPIVPGFVLRTVSFEANDLGHFCRVRVELNE